MSLITYDSLEAVNGTILSDHVGEVGAAWIRNSAFASAAPKIYWNQLTIGSAGMYYPGTLPTTDDYSIAADFLCKVDGSGASQIMARASTSAYTGYALRYLSGVWSLLRWKTGASTSLATFPQTLDAGKKARGKLLVTGNGATVTIKAYIDGVEVMSYDDTSTNRLTSGVPSVQCGGAPSYIGGIHLANITVEDILADHIVVLQEKANAIVQRDGVGTTTNLPIRGCYSGSPTGIECRIVSSVDGVTVIKDWTALTNLTMSNGYFSGQLPNTPNGAWYFIQARFVGGGATFSGAKRFGIGVLVGIIGQSNAANWFIQTGCAQAADDRVWVFDPSGWRAANSVLSGCAALAFGRTLADAIGCPVGLLYYAVGSTGLLTKATQSASYWENTAAGGYQDLYRHGCFEVGGKIDCSLWVQGELEGTVTVVTITAEEYKTGLDNFFASIRGWIEDANHPIHLAPLGLSESGSEAAWQNVREAQLQKLAEPNVYWGGAGYDLARSDVHYTAASYPLFAARCARSLLRRYGASGGGYGPKATKAIKYSDTVYDIEIQHDTGTDITLTNASIFEVFDGSAPITVSSAVKKSATLITITLAAAVTAPSIYVCYGKVTTVTGPVNDNSTGQLPLRQSSALAVEAPHANSLPTGSVNISGTPTQGQTLTASNTLADSDGIGGITYAWQADGQPIATGSSLTLTETEIGKSITVTASYVDGYGTAEAVMSAAVGPVAALPAATIIQPSEIARTVRAKPRIQSVVASRPMEA